jgi:hypothetical protein
MAVWLRGEHGHVHDPFVGRALTVVLEGPPNWSVNCWATEGLMSRTFGASRVPTARSNLVDVRRSTYRIGPDQAPRERSRFLELGARVADHD